MRSYFTQDLNQHESMSRVDASEQSLITKLSPSEWRRRLCHMLPGLVSLMMSLVPHMHPLSWISFLGAMAVILGGAICARRFYPAIARPGETRWTLNIIEYSSMLIFLLVVFPAHPEFASVVVAVLAFGDGSATLIGLLFGGPRLPWNGRKTWTGFVGSIAFSLPLVTLAYWLEVQPAVSLSVAATCALSAVLCGQMAESLPSCSSDNFRVGLAASSGIIIAHLMVFGLN